MRLLLDTHSFVWWLADSGRLSAKAFALIADESHDIFVSAATAWELSTMDRPGEPPSPEAPFDIAGAMADQGFHELPVSVRDAEIGGRLPGDHRDPFAPLLAAQALSRGLVIVSGDESLDRYGVDRVW